jgi:hypothetical protein
VAVEGQSGAIVGADVAEGADEVSTVEGVVNQCEEVVGKKPARLLADSNFSSGETLERLEAEGVVPYLPSGTEFRKMNPANRPDPTEAVSADQRDRLPRTKTHLNANAFVYDEEHDCYSCPMGKVLEFQTTGRHHRSGNPYRRYACPGAEGCPLADRCVKGKARRRTVARDRYQDARDRAGRRLASAEGQAIYARRAPVAEGVFGIIKFSLGIRQFLLRGMKKVKIEWNWICGAFNLKKLLRLGSGSLQPKGGVA